MSNISYRQFCPVAMAAEVLCKRWTLLLVRELMLGSRHFNELRRGVPRMSTSLLAQRLRHLEDIGVVRRTHSGNVWEYGLTEAGGLSFVQRPDRVNVPGSCGTELPGTEWKLGEDHEMCEL